MTGRDPWSDPSTPTEQAPPYAGPPYAGPPYAGPPYQGQPYPNAGYGPPPPQYGWPPAGGYPWPYAAPYPWWTGPPPGPRRPGQVVGAAVLAFVQSALVAIGSLYTFLIATMVGFASEQSLQVPGVVGRLATEARIVAVVQLLSVVLLVVAGVFALANRPRRAAWPLLLTAFGVQVALAVYWTIRLAMLTSDIPGNNSGAPFLSLSLFFAAPPVVGLGLVLFGPGRHWFATRGEQAVRGPGAV